MALATFSDVKLTVADSVWVATALLQHANQSAKFTTDQIVQKVQSEGLSDAKESSIRQHVTQHCVANRIAQPNTACMLFALGRGDRRLFREGDLIESGRNPERTHPNPEDIPAKYHDLIHWYKTEWFPRRQQTNVTKPAASEDPLLNSAGTGRDIWRIDAVIYIQKLREERPEKA